MPVYEDIQAFAEIGGDPAGITRLAWTPELARAHARLRERCAENGMEAASDAAGNMIGRWHDGEPGAAVAIGSHLDTVPRGGAFDGALGVLAGLGAVEQLHARGFRPRRPTWVISFMDEEGARFGASMFGSRAFCGEPVDDAAEREDADGVTLREAMRAQGHDFADVGSANAVARIGHYLELHIEQGPRLETAGVDVGIVDGCYGASLFHVRLDGEANHAGTTPWDRRRDALAGAARIVTELRDAAAAAGMTATVGQIGVEPGGFNIIPGRCELTIDVRTPPDEDPAAAQALVAGLVARIASDERLEHRIEVADADPGVVFDAELVAVLEQAADDVGASHMRMASGAGHDAMVLSRHVPTAMLFVPSVGGISHSPRERTSQRHCELGTAVLARAVELLAGVTQGAAPLRMPSRSPR